MAPLDRNAAPSLGPALATGGVSLTRRGSRCYGRVGAFEDCNMLVFGVYFIPVQCKTTKSTEATAESALRRG